MDKTTKVKTEARMTRRKVMSGRRNRRKILKLLGEDTGGDGSSCPTWDVSSKMETSILNQYEEEFPDIFQSQNPAVERLGDALMNFVNNDDQSGTIDIIDFILHDDEQQDTQALYEFEDGVNRPLNSQQHACAIDDDECMTSLNLSNRECLSSTPPVEHLFQAHIAETYYQSLVDVGSPTEEQSIVNVKKANPPKVINDADTSKTENKEKIEKEISDTVNKSQEIRKPAKRTIKQVANIKKNQITKRRKIRKENYTLTKTHREEQEDCIDVETVSDEIPVLQAGDVTSLLEQFEATENMTLPQTSHVKKNHKSRAKSTGRPRGRPRKHPKSQGTPKKPTSRCNDVQETDQDLLSRVIEKLRKAFPRTPKREPKKPASHCNNVRETDKDLQPRVVIERLKMVQNHETDTLAITDATMEQPDISNCDTNQIQNDKLVLCSNESLKAVNSTVTSLKNSSNDVTQSRINNSFISVYHDHDYFCNSNSITSNTSSNKLTKHTSKTQKNKNKDSVKNNETIKYCRDSNLKKNTDLVSTKVSDTCKVPSTSSVLNKETLTNSSLRNNQGGNCSKEAPLRQIQANNLPTTKTVNVPNKITKDTPVLEMKIKSALAKSILKSRQDLLKKMQMQAYPTQQMVSVLKNPPNTSQSSILTNNLKESVVTTTNTTNEIIQNIIIQNTDEQEQVKQPVRKRLKIEEYRSRKQKYNGNVTAPSKRHVELVPIYNAFTSTEPFTDDLGNQILCQQEHLLHTRYKPDTEEENKPKPTTRDAETQTYRGNCEPSTKSSIPNESRYTLERNGKSNFSRSRLNSVSRKTRSRSRNKTKKDKKKSNAAERTERSTESRSMERSLKSKHRDKSRDRRESRSKTRSTSRSRSIDRSSEGKSDSSKGSRSSNDSKTRNGSSTKRRERSRSRSRSRSQCRGRSRKRRSHSRQQRRRRSSVSSSPSSSGSSRSKYQRSRSRSYRSRSRSSSRHYINRSRPSSHSNSERNRWSNRRNSRERSYERYKRQASYEHRDRDWRSRSPSHYYHRRDDWYYEEKQRQVDERRVIYVGGIDRNTTKTDLYRRFDSFGPVVDVSIHLRDNNDSYGFITFLYRDDAYKAMEHGNDNLDLPQYDLSFGGRRAFCQVKYEDLDGMPNDPFSRRSSPGNEEGIFDYLLREAKKRLD